MLGFRAHDPNAESVALGRAAPGGHRPPRGGLRRARTGRLTTTQPGSPAPVDRRTEHGSVRAHWPGRRPVAARRADPVQAPDSEHGPYAGLIRRIRAVDAATVEFRLCAPDVAFPTRLAFAAFAINDTAWLKSHVDPGP